ncbi:hypothetical protein REPUB_Repub03eG0246800 [Reevesia pubescens]
MFFLDFGCGLLCFLAFNYYFILVLWIISGHHLFTWEYRELLSSLSLCSNICKWMSFESLCLEMQVGTALDTVEQLVEEQSLDPLFSDKTNVMDAVHNLSTGKKAEIQYLRGLLERAEEHNRVVQAQVDLLKNKTQEVSGTTDVVEKLRGGILSYTEHKMSGF